MHENERHPATRAEAFMSLFDPFIQEFRIFLNCCPVFVLDYMPRNLSFFHGVFHHFRNEVTRFYSAEIIMALEYLRTINIVHR